eukprot:CAMPEP_0118682800 /NCGR_PEP_ID=MMETSP0800-20121206/5678_1 /TAXON_ID=210618 ORGANISM="Striatella unipunctata, Strain CCMP2910" /NCGR_SAMPLE_ID=MMETSP0800 /ASSEMBLY_ACC=CAM_ASM_000638 /LENGTH=391 /DNA_ID=CAMNT_0006579213 /DNA_START=38 /DNA_END=1213 /DNA_ORIENTATION=-
MNFQQDSSSSGKKLTLSHYVKGIATPMGISHLLCISQSASRRLHLRLARAPVGPTLTFEVEQFSLSKEIRAIQRRPYQVPGADQHSPIVVTNNFGDKNSPPHVKLMRITFQNMFPAINVASVKLQNCRRVVLFNYSHQDKKDNDNGEEGEARDFVEVRHYAIKATPVGVNKKVRRLVQTKIPNLNNVEDISDYITGQTASGALAPSVAGGAMSDSEAEDETSHVVLPQKYAGKGNSKSQKSALKLVELGPRLRLKLYKVERGLGSGDVMYHAYIKKSLEEVKERKEKEEREAALKKQRRDEQNSNVERKRKAKEEKLERKKQKREDREKATMDSLRGNLNEDDDEGDDSESEEEMDDESEDSKDDDDSDDQAESDGDDDEEEEENNNESNE